MVDTGLAEKLGTSVYFDQAGNEVSDDNEKKYGRKCNMKLTKPSYILFGDETGCNTNQTSDGNFNGEKFICGRGQVPRKSSSATDHRFTLLPITAANGNAVIYVVIFKSKRKKPPVSWKTGIDVRVKPRTKTIINTEGGEIAVPDESDIENYGPGKYFPYGPACHHNGKTIPCATFVSEGGGITAEILVEILMILDKLEVFPRIEGAIPFILLDGCLTWLNPLFLAYVNNPDHKRKVCLGVPYATTL